MAEPINWDELNGAQRKVVRETLRAAFDRPALDMFLSDYFSKNLDDLVEPGTFEKQVFDLISRTQREGWTADLIASAQTASDNPKIRALSSVPQLSIDGDDKLVSGSLEKTVRQRGGFQDVALWAEKLTDIRHRVCRIEDAARTPKALGTGFLIGPGLVLTNQHVVQSYLDGANRDSLACRFDFAIEAVGQNDGRLVSLAGEWCVAHAAHSKADLTDDGSLPAPGELDFAILRLAQPAEEDALSNGRRGWIKLSTTPARPGPGDIVFVCQHPEGEPIKLAVGAVLQNHGSRIRYDANTMPGSSGSPCFDAALDLVGYHHLGDPRYSKLARWNQGIAVDPLLAFLETQAGLPSFR